MTSESSKTVPTVPPKPVVLATTACPEAVKVVIEALNKLSPQDFSEIVIAIMEDDDIGLPNEFYNSLIESLGKIPKSIVTPSVVDYLFDVLENDANFSSNDWDETNALVVEALGKLISKEKVGHLTGAVVDYLDGEITNDNHKRMLSVLERVTR